MTPQEMMAAADAAYDAGRHGEAAGLYARLAAVAPAHPLPLFNLAAARRDAGDVGAALAWFQRAARLLPDPRQACRAAAACALKLGRAGEAAAAMSAAAAAAPDDVESAQGLADAVKTQGDYRRAAALYRRALTLDPARAPAWFNLGVTEADRCEHAAAAAAAARAVRLRPDDAVARFNLAYELLTLGRLAEGFAAYECRFDGVVERPRHPLPWWRGEPLTGKRLLLFAEQGHGDGIHFARYATLAARAGAAVGIEAPPALLRLLATVPGVARVHALGMAPVGDYDLFCPLMSLPHLFATTLETIPAQIPYVADRFDGDERFDRCFPAGDRRFKVGLVWSGDPRRGDPRHADANRRRSLTLDQLAPLLAPLLDAPDVVFYSLQAGEARAELAASPFAGRILDPMEEVRDFADTAGMIRRLDLVISVCTATAHLAGAMGKPVWLPLARRACWRWLSGRDDSPWYPAARLFRQTAPEDWGAVIAAIGMRLDEITLPRRRSSW